MREIFVWIPMMSCTAWMAFSELLVVLVCGDSIERVIDLLGTLLYEMFASYVEDVEMQRRADQV